MKALVLIDKHKVKIGQFSEPYMDSNAIKVEVSYCGLCGTDLHKYEGRNGARQLVLPVPLGHEVSGVVKEIGDAVDGFKVGDRVVVDPNWNCGYCDYCRSGYEHMCENSYGVVKGMADYICPPSKNVYKIPNSLSLRDAVLAEPLSCCLHGMDLLDVKIGENVVIVGMGAIGAIMVQLCRMASATEIIVIESVEEKRKKAFALGATRFINPIQEDVVKTLKDLRLGNITKVMECVGSSSSVNIALNVAGKSARVVLFGMGNPEEPIVFNNYAAILKELDVQCSFLNPHTTLRAINLLACGAIDVENIVSKEMSAEELVEELKERTYSKQGKVIIKWKEFE